VVALLSSVSTKVMLNGSSGNTIFYYCGLRQGDPLSLMLFLLVMEVLSAIIQKADHHSLLCSLQVPSIPHRMTFYVDDLILFIPPEMSDIQCLSYIFGMFQGASSLGCNISKCQMVPICCTHKQIQIAFDGFPCQVMQFQIKYLGLPLVVGKLLKMALQPLVDKMEDKLMPWKR
jgi:hypothetical protein